MSRLASRVETLLFSVLLYCSFPDAGFILDVSSEFH